MLLGRGGLAQASPRALIRGLFTLSLLVSPSASYAGEIVLQNDSTTNGTPSTVFANFVAGESVAVSLTSSCQGDIVAAQVYWASQFGGAPSSIEERISIFSSGTFPTPGPLLLNQGGGDAEILGPTLTDGIMNEFRHLDPPIDATPLSVPVSQGETFVVSLKLFNTNSGNPFAPSVVADQDGCQASRNAVDVLPGGWVDACVLGVTGDWVIRAVVDCDEPPIPTADAPGRVILVGAMAVLGAIAASRPLVRRATPSGGYDY
jgi:hypothetical protein